MSNTFSLNEAAAYLGVSYRTMRRYIKKGLPYSEVQGARGPEYLVRQDDLLDFKKKAARKLKGAERTMSRRFLSPEEAPYGGGDGAGPGDTSSFRVPAFATEFFSTKLLERLEEENGFLREQLLAKDRQLEVKDSQLADYHEIVKRLSHQNEVLTMIAQGIEPMKLLKGGEPSVYEPAAPEEEDSAAQTFFPGGEQKAPLFSREEIVVRARNMHREGKSTQEIREFIQAQGYDSFGDLLRSG